MTDEKKIEELPIESEIACILSTRGVLSQYHINDSVFLANELMPLINRIKKEVAKEILDELETLYGNWMLQKETGWNKLTVSVAIKELRKKWGIE